MGYLIVTAGRVTGLVPQPGIGIRGTSPACAGSIEKRPARWRGSLDHPRVRGEHIEARELAGLFLGPSPRARGAHLEKDQAPGFPGTIPACAGSTRGAAQSRGILGDHPRVRGEHGEVVTDAEYAQGPSPRARGAPLPCCDITRPSGTIPACAGSTQTQKQDPRHVGDHPRVRGEHSVPEVLAASMSGPSPRARGAPRTHVRRVGGTGTIPACAGSTRRSGSVRAATRDHPRVRGEHSTVVLPRSPWLGPSPRARGAHMLRRDQTAEMGTIPACAGSTLVDLRVSARWPLKMSTSFNSDISRGCGSSAACWWHVGTRVRFQVFS